MKPLLSPVQNVVRWIAAPDDSKRLFERKVNDDRPHRIRRMLQGAVMDPFGHMWLVGKVLE